MPQPYPPQALTIPEKPAKRWIWIVSSIVFLAVVVLNRVQVPAPDGLDVHVFARINAVIRRTRMLPPNLQVSEAGRQLAFGEWRLDTTARHLLDAQDTAYPLSGAEFRLLRVFLDHANGLNGYEDGARGPSAWRPIPTPADAEAREGR